MYLLRKLLSTLKKPLKTIFSVPSLLRTSKQLKLLNIKSKTNLLNNSIVGILPINKARIGFFHSVNKNSVYPLYLAAVMLIEEKGKDEIFCFFENFRKKYQVNNANDWLGVSVFPENSDVFDGYFPWENIDPNKRKASRKENVRNENLEYGLDSYDFFGAINCSYKKSEVEMNRIYNIHNSIKENGFLWNKNVTKNISVVIFKKKNNYVFMVAGGNHRIAVMSALNHKEVKCNILGVVDREDVYTWKFVKDGTYSVEEALFVFDRIYYSLLPEAFESWRKYIAK